jgi:hypothetical protein
MCILLQVPYTNKTTLVALNILAPTTIVTHYASPHFLFSYPRIYVYLFMFTFSLLSLHLVVYTDRASYVTRDVRLLGVHELQRSKLKSPTSREMWVFEKRRHQEYANNYCLMMFFVKMTWSGHYATWYNISTGGLLPIIWRQLRVAKTPCNRSCECWEIRWLQSRMVI